MINLILGNCIEKMKDISDCSIDAIICDPPYNLGFMGKAWDSTGIANNINVWKECLRILKFGGHLLAFSSTRTYHRMACAIEDSGFEIRDMIEWVYGSGFPKSLNIGKVTGKSDWDGWGTALKPAHEPICFARKPLSEKTISDNCLKWGTGGLNVDASRIDTVGGNRFPANLIHDGSNDVLECFPETKSGGGDKHGRKSSTFCASTDWKKFKGTSVGGDSGNASRFFKSIIYVAKASKYERGNNNIHPTVKPIALMEYLISMVTRDNQTVLDPFMGSGTTGMASINLNRNFIGIELDNVYFQIAEQRINSLRNCLM